MITAFSGILQVIFIALFLKAWNQPGKNGDNRRASGQLYLKDDFDERGVPLNVFVSDVRMELFDCAPQPPGAASLPVMYSVSRDTVFLLRRRVRFCFC
jgi:hypothetical protein